MITTLLLSGYSLTSSVIFLKYLQRFLQDSTTANSDRGSWIVLILASLIWPISLPMSALERNVQKNKFSFQDSESQVGLIGLDRPSQSFSEFSSPSIAKDQVEV
jgi:hypothetical protein